MTVLAYFKWDAVPELKEYLREGLKDIDAQLHFSGEFSEEENENFRKKADVLVGWRPSEQLLNEMTDLRVFINPGAGVQHLKQFADIFKNRGITVINGHGNAYFTAQHTVSILLSLMNKVNFHHNAMKEGRWRLGDAQAASIPMRDINIGFLGYGHVNSLVHRFLSGFDVKFSVFKRTDSKKHEYPTVIEEYDNEKFDTFLKDIDTLITAVPLTPKTEGMIGSKELEMLGKNGIIVSVGRGPVIDEKALYNALKERVISGAAVDVWYDYKAEPDEQGRRYPFNYPFHELDNIVLSPHRAASPFSDLRRWNEVVENITRISQGHTDLLNIVDIDEGY